MPRFVDDHARFLAPTAGNAVVRAAIAHAQFETNHPFIGGNVRTGRALIHTVLCRADALSHTLTPISTGFAGDTSFYIRGLTALRENSPNLDEWAIGFSRATELASENAVHLTDRLESFDSSLPS